MAKVTKQQIIEGLIKAGKLFTVNEEVQSMIDYNVDSFNENPRNVTMEDLKEVISEVEKTSGVPFAKVLGSMNIAKKEEKAKLPTKKEEGTQTSLNISRTGDVVTTKVKSLEDEFTPEEIKKIEKITNKGKDEPKVKNEKSVKVQPKAPKKVVEKEIFPETFKSASLKATLKRRDDIKSITSVMGAYNNDEDIVLVTYWTKKHLKQFAGSYDPMGINPNCPKSFEHDLDLIEITYANELVVTGCSLYSYVPQILRPMDFEPDEDGMMYANGCEIAVYEVME